MNLLFENNKDELANIQRKTDVREIPLEILAITYAQSKYIQVDERNDLHELLKYMVASEAGKNKKVLSSVEKIKLKELKSTYNSILRFNFSRDLTLVMNNLEWIALSVNSSVATEQVLYDVIAPTFLRLCKWLYVQICEANGEYSRTYLNIAKLYRKWAEKIVKDNEKQRRLKEESTNNGDVGYTSLEEN